MMLCDHAPASWRRPVNAEVLFQTRPAKLARAGGLLSNLHALPPSITRFSIACVLSLFLTPRIARVGSSGLSRKKNLSSGIQVLVAVRRFHQWEHCGESALRAAAGVAIGEANCRKPRSLPLAVPIQRSLPLAVPIQRSLPLAVPIQRSLPQLYFQRLREEGGSEQVLLIGFSLD